MGRRLGEFVVGELIGQGGFGSVYRAHQALLDRPAVIKVLQSDLRSQGPATERFLREARLASRLDHPYAAHIYAFGAESDGILWIAMELVRGTPLSEYLRVHGPLPIERFVPLLERICEVVHTAHEQGIIHRDIKPANVMVLVRAGRLLPKLLDFGIAKLITETDDGETEVQPARFDDKAIGIGDTMEVSGAASDKTVKSSERRAPRRVVLDDKLTQRGATLGSPHYMAPEQWNDATSVTGRTDLYALGILAFEALNGAPPFTGKSMLELASAHIAGLIPRQPDHLPRSLDAVFDRALAKDPEARFDDALAMASAFRNAAGLSAGKRALPRLDAAVRERFVALAPQPIAEAVLAFDSATDARQARDALWVITTLLARWLGLVALAARSRLGPAHDAADALSAVRDAGTSIPTDEQWLAIAHSLVRGYASKPDLSPIPELVLFFCDGAGPQRHDELLALRGPLADPSATDDAIVERLAAATRMLSKLLEDASFVCDYEIVVPVDDAIAERWIGVRRAQRELSLKVGTGATLVDATGAPVLTLHPLVQAKEPAPGVAPALFMYTGRDARGAQLSAAPFELHDPTVIDWLRVQMADSGEHGDVLDDVERPPYRGLEAFTTDDAAFFFGRERLVDGFVNRLRVEPLIAVVGPSGAGKSSFVQAGAIPALTGWVPLILRPGLLPLYALGARLGAAGIQFDLLEPSSLGDVLRAAAAREPIVLVIDQFEEVFTLCRDPSERHAFAEAISSVARSADDRVRVIVTLRDDFLVAAETLPGLRDRLAQALQLLTTPDHADLERILVEPARRVGYEFEDRELPAKMVEEVVGRPGALALLSFTASRLWEHRDRHFRRLPTRAYEALGGVGGALARHADALLESSPLHEKRLVREVFRHLVTAEGTRAVMSRRELVTVMGGGVAAGAVIERLVASRLLIVRDAETDEQIEVTHEALLLAWPRLLEWRREDAEGARLRDQIRVAARQWDARNRPRGLLWRDDALVEYRLWRSRYPGSLTEVEEAFGAASLRAVRRARIRTIGLLLAVPVVIAATYFTLEIRARGEVERKVDEKRSLAIELLTEVRAAVTESERLRTGAYALFDAKKAAEAEAAWANAQQASARAERAFGRASQPIESALNLDHERSDMRALLADLLYERALLAERDGRIAQRDELVSRLELYDDDHARRKRLDARARLDITTDPAAQVTLERYQSDNHRMRLGPARVLARPLTSLQLEPGTYRITAEVRDRAVVHYPVQLARGESLAVAIEIPPRIPEGFVYVPPGRFLLGSKDEGARRDFLGTVPAHLAHTTGYFIARHETTYGEWIRFLEDLPLAERTARLPKSASSSNGAVSLAKIGERWRLTIQPTTLAYTAFAGERLRYRARDRRIEHDWLRWPVGGVSFEDARAYATWLHAKGIVPGARLCTEHEWERAARGADDREFPTGDRIDPDDANFDETYGKQPEAFGPDEVGSHPESRSPFGIDDMTGNVWEWTIGSIAEPVVLRGGSYYHGQLTSRSTNRWATEPAARELVAGVRLCADR